MGVLRGGSARAAIAYVLVAILASTRLSGAFSPEQLYPSGPSSDHHHPRNSSPAVALVEEDEEDVARRSVAAHQTRSGAFPPEQLYPSGPSLDHHPPRNSSPAAALVEEEEGHVARRSVAAHETRVAVGQKSSLMRDHLALVRRESSPPEDGAAADSIRGRLHRFTKSTLELGRRVFCGGDCGGHAFQVRLSFAALALLLFLMCRGSCTGLTDQTKKDEKLSGGGAAGGGPPPGEPQPGGGTEKASKPKSSWHAIFGLVRMWLTDPQCWLTARCFVFIALVHWALRESLWAFVFSQNHAEVINAITALQVSKDIGRVRHSMLYALGWDIFVLLPLMHFIDPWVRAWFQLSFRNFATTRILRAYLDEGGHAFYRIKMKESDNRIDNPDQRIGEDMDNMATQFYDLYSSVLSALFGIISWSVVIVLVGGRLVFAVAFVMANIRFLVAYGYFGTRIVDAKKKVLSSAAGLRYGLSRMRENAEGVALSGGEQEERRRAEGLFHENLSAVRGHTWISMWYGGVIGLLNNFPWIIIWLCQLPAIMSGTLLVGDGIRVTQGYDQLMKVLDFMADNFTTIMILQANGERVYELWAACSAENCRKAKRGPLHGTADLVPAQGQQGMASSDLEAALVKYMPVADGVTAATDQMQQTPSAPPRSQITFEPADARLAFAVEDLVVGAPGSDLRVGGVTLSCSVGSGLLVSGSSGIGKSSVLRALGGLWLDGKGTVRRAASAEVFFLPQACYAPQGTLLEAVLYPASEAAVVALIPDITAVLEELAAGAFCRAALGPLLEHWGLKGDAHDWPAILSTGEKQRVGFARLFLRLALRARLAAHAQAAATPPPPDIIAVMDESTSGLGIDVEAHMYEELQGEVQGAFDGGLLAFVSVGHRPTLPRFHDTELQIGGLRPGGGPEGTAVAAAAGAQQSLLSPAAREVLGEGTWVAPDGTEVPWWHVKITS
eukprot:CAMPEP_0117465448 /NCGR_PEP_ID=MMETSP0784-20121206/4632_1 /TAXON_ID=39447 /ORGANISM="" /LENGTH=951 /DNA_ID=CAMNT_0005259359 /DNA_START=53 /DNA_END=2908 /DNA_ORIENTATION=+